MDQTDQGLGAVWSEKSFGQRLKFGAGGGEICASGGPNDFFRSSETPNTPTHYSKEPLKLSFSSDEIRFGVYPELGRRDSRDTK